jgi:hypothetical protein
MQDFRFQTLNVSIVPRAGCAAGAANGVNSANCISVFMESRKLHSLFRVRVDVNRFAQVAVMRDEIRIPHAPSSMSSNASTV